MSTIKIIKTEQEHQDALKLVEEFISRDPDPNSEEGERLNLLSTLIKDYEDKTFPTDLPDPIAAINFRMEQMGLKPADLIPFIGSRGRVSEILAGKRQVTLEMVRALESGLGIPAKVLIKKPTAGGEQDYQLWDKRLVGEMEERGYFEGAPLTESNKVELLQKFFSLVNPAVQVVGMLRQSNFRSSPLTDKRALAAWAARVYNLAQDIKSLRKYQKGTVDLKFMEELAQLSKQDDGPVAAQKYLLRHGIKLVIEFHFPKTYLDGAVILIDKDNPVIGLTLRHDRLDNFWFTLMHELAHLALHYDSGITLFYDEIEDVKAVGVDQKEHDADLLAEEALLPKAKWEISPARLIPSLMAAKSLAKELGVHVAIIAGQIRHKGGKYIYLSKIVNEAKVRHYFAKKK